MPISELSAFGITLLIIGVAVFLGLRYTDVSEKAFNALRIFAFSLTGGGVIALVAASFYIVEPGYIGIEVVMGNVRSFAENGMHLKIPVSKVVYFETRTIKDEYDIEAASMDLQQVNMRIAINYKINKPMIKELFINKAKNFAALKRNGVDPFVNQVTKAATANYPIEKIIVKRQDLKSNITIGLKENLTSYYLLLDTVNIVNITFSPEFNKVVEEKQIQEQKIKTAEYKRQQAEQEAQAEIIRAKAEAEKQKLLKENTSREVIELKWIEKWNGELPQITSGDGGMIPMINLKK